MLDSAAAFDSADHSGAPCIDQVPTLVLSRGGTPLHLEEPEVPTGLSCAPAPASDPPPQVPEYPPDYHPPAPPPGPWPAGPPGWVLTAALLLDGLCLGLMLSPPATPQPGYPFLLFFAHLLSVGPAALALQEPLRGARTPTASLWVRVAVCFCLPALGILVLVAHAHRARRRSWSVESAPTTLQCVPVPDLPRQPLASVRFQARDRGALLGVLRRSRDVARRREAVLALQRMQGPAALEILRVALRDPEEEVRQLAYSVLGRQEQVVVSRIQHLLQDLEETAPAQRQSLHKRLGEEYWELCLLGIGSGPAGEGRGEIEAYLLAAARRHGEAAVELRPDDAEMHFLLGRVLLRQGESDRAHACFLRSLSWGMARVKVLPYLAEAAFQQREFGAVRKYVEAMDPVACLAQPVLGAIRQNWR